MMMMSQPQPNRRPENAMEWAAWAAVLADSKKATNIQVLRTEKVTTLAECFVICSGQSRTQVRAIAEEVVYAFKQQGLQASSDERDTQSSWILLDYGDIIIHIMQEDTREYYQLEAFWSHADTLPSAQWQEVATTLGLLTF